MITIVIDPNRGVENLSKVTPKSWMVQPTHLLKSSDICLYQIDSFLLTPDNVPVVSQDEKYYPPK